MYRRATPLLPTLTAALPSASKGYHSPRGSRLLKAANITLLRLCHTWTENARRPARGAALLFGGVCTCRAGPMCPAAGYAFFGGARGPRPTGRYVEPRVGDDVPSARQRRAGRRIPTPVFALAWNDSASRCLGGRSRPPLQVFIGDSHAGRRTPRAFVPLRSTAGRRPLRNDGNGRTESSAPVHSPRCIFSSVSRRMAARSSVR